MAGYLAKAHKVNFVPSFLEEIFVKSAKNWSRVKVQSYLQTRVYCSPIQLVDQMIRTLLSSPSALFYEQIEIYFLLRRELVLIALHQHHHHHHYHHHHYPHHHTHHYPHHHPHCYQHHHQVTFGDNLDARQGGGGGERRRGEEEGRHSDRRSLIKLYQLHLCKSF